MGADKKMYTEREMSELTGKSRKTLYNWRKEGKGPSFKRVGRTVFYPSDRYDEWRLGL